MPVTALRGTVYSNVLTGTSAESPSQMSRVASLDIVRGVVMVLMAIDHVRVYSGLPAGGPTPGIFFTRWITHFVAPAFLFLAGTSAYLYGQRAGEKRKLATFLLTRGLWLVLLELTAIRVAWTFNFDFANYMPAGVIWMIGWCMVLMSGIVFLPHKLIARWALRSSSGHNVTNFLPAAMTSLAEGSFATCGRFSTSAGTYSSALTARRCSCCSCSFPGSV